MRPNRERFSIIIYLLLILASVLGLAFEVDWKVPVFVIAFSFIAIVALRLTREKQIAGNDRDAWGKNGPGGAGVLSKLPGGPAPLEGAAAKALPKAARRHHRARKGMASKT